MSFTTNSFFWLILYILIKHDLGSIVEALNMPYVLFNVLINIFLRSWRGMSGV